jgi:hypothetical protein
MFKKLIKFFCASACILLFCSLTPLDQAVRDFSTPYVLTVRGIPVYFDIQLWVNGGPSYSDPTIQLPPHTLFTTGTNAATTSQVFYYNLQVQPPRAVFLEFSSSLQALNLKDGNAFASNAKIYDKLTIPITGNQELPTSTLEAFYAGQTFIDNTIIHDDKSLDTPSDIVTFDYQGDSFFHFYDLSAYAGLDGYMLGAVVSSSEFTQVALDGGYTYSILLYPGWSQMQEEEPIFDTWVFLFGPAMSPTPVPEPQTYLILGTLLGVAAFIARRKRQVA